MLYMVIERFRDGDPVPVYRRLEDRGRMMPEGLEYVSSWVDTSMERCFQLMQTSDPDLVWAWTARWNDIVDFEVVPVVSSDDAKTLVGKRP